jgi:hypothetical protein
MTDMDLTVLKPEYRAAAATLVWNLLGSSGGIYSNTIKTTFRDDYSYHLAFSVGGGRHLGILFAHVEQTPSGLSSRYGSNYYLGQFRDAGVGARKFAEFALKNFIETETWDVVGNFKPVYFTDVVPYYLDGTEIVSHYA